MLSESDGFFFLISIDQALNIFVFLGIGIFNFYVLLMDIEGGGFLGILNGCYHNA